MDDEKGRELKRRDFIRRAAATGAAAAFAAPMIQSVAATPAFAGTQGSPAPGGCWHSISLPDKPNGCMNTCKEQDKICGPPDGVCALICNPACNLPENACPDEYCDISCWSCDTDHNPIFICL